MKTSEEKLDEALRAALKRKFDHFEDAPNPSAYEKIRAQLKPGRQWKYLFFALLFVGVGIVGIMTDQHMLKKKTARMSKIAVSAGAYAEVSEKRSEKFKVDEPISREVVLKASADIDHLTKDNAVQNRSKIEVESVLGNDLFSNERNSEQEVKDVILPNYNAVNEEVAKQNFNYNVNELESKALKLTSVNPNLPGISLSKINNAPNVSRKSNLHLLFNAAVLQSYQILTVPSGGQKFQNFHFPSTFSLRSLGYKVSAGAERKGFQFLLHYSRFQQSYSYEIAGDEYVVQPGDQNDYEVIRQGTRVSQEKKFSLLGIGINRQFTWGNTHLSKYYAVAGLEYSHAINSRQHIGWVNAGIGKQFPLSKGTSIQIGPYAEFSPVKFSGSGDPFLYQPYRVGISAGLRFAQ